MDSRNGPNARSRARSRKRGRTGLFVDSRCRRTVYAAFGGQDGKLRTVGYLPEHTLLVDILDTGIVNGRILTIRGLDIERNRGAVGYRSRFGIVLGACGGQQQTEAARNTIQKSAFFHGSELLKIKQKCCRPRPALSRCRAYLRCCHSTHPTGQNRLQA